jgi:HSP20 family protein
MQTNGTALALRPFGGLVDDLLTGPLGHWLEGSGRTNGSFPPVNIEETADAYVLDMVATGWEKSDFRIKLDGREVLISAEKKQEQGEDKENRADDKHILREFGLRAFRRSFLIDEKIEAAKISAAYENGVLKVTFPKKEEALQEHKEIAVS